MKLTKKHIGQAFDIDSSDGSWFYILLDVSRTELLFRAQNGKYWREKRAMDDWRPYSHPVKAKINLADAWKNASKSWEF